MKHRLSLRWVAAAAVMLASLTLLSSCNTIKGAGRDVENVGAAVHDAASR